MAAKKKTAEPSSGGTTVHVDVPEMRTERLELWLVGLSPLVVHAWSAKALEEMRTKQQRKAATKREAKDPTAEYNSARYRMPGGKDGFPTTGIKNAMVSACRYVEGMTMVQARGAFFVNLGSELVEIVHSAKQPKMREDAVRVGGMGPGTGKADLRYRPEYNEWRIRVMITFNPSVFTNAQIVNLLRHAGFHVGLGEHRPERGGQWGMFEPREIDE